MIKRSDFLTGEVIDLKDEIALLSPTDTPLTTMLMGMGKVVPANDITVTWRERQLNTDRGTLKLEGAEAGTVITSSRSSLSNLCQIIEKVTAVSGTANALNPKGIGNSFQAEVNDRLIETKRDLEWYFLNGTKTVEADATPRQMSGLLNLIHADNVFDATTAGLSESLLLDSLQSIWNAGAQGEYFMFANATPKRLLNELFKNSSNARFIMDKGMDNEYGIGITKIVSDFGNINIILNRHMPANALLTVDLDEVEIAELRGTFYEDLPKSGDYFKGHVLNESTIKLLNSKAGSKIIGVSALAV